ncbi:MAG: hypothetical protein ICV79_29555 [Flavisolibacter sp.]|nr:hypothetical protein [Flavisolibacter sp.]
MNAHRKQKIDLLIALIKGEKLPENVLNELPVKPFWLLDKVPYYDETGEIHVPTEEENIQSIKDFYGAQTIVIKRKNGYILLNTKEPVRGKPDWMTEPPGKIDDE